MKALISVYNKEGIHKLAKALEELGYEIISTGGTARFLKEKGIKVTEVSSITNFPEILGGRVKSLHPKIHGGILYRDWVEEDKRQVEEHGIPKIDVLVVNLYPFEEKLKEGLPERELMEFVDIGGPALIRAGAKNFFRVVVLVDPEDYDWVIEKLRKGALTVEDRAYLAQKAFSLTAYYDALIAGALKRLHSNDSLFTFEALPLKRLKKLRYGENPHQRGFLYENPLEELGITKAQVLQGKEMSFNNYLDADSALRLVSEFPNDTVCAIIKHTNPCGVAVGKTPEEAFKRALDADPVSAFGGIVAFNDKLDPNTAKELTSLFLEIVIAPDYDEEALAVLSKKKNLRVIKVFGLQSSLDVKKVSGGYLLQDEDTVLYENLKVVTKKEPSAREMHDLVFAWKVVKHAKSNAVVIAKDQMTLGIGTGNVSRVDSLKCAIAKAKERGFSLKGAVVASEAFFPFRDSIDIMAKEGISAVIQPGGSIRDEEVIRACDEHGIAMLFTNMRHFKH
ncbi:MAG: bifunctional phosphoribosylaminoimidazolecarboxamide formyltransferase/IMP cyclohydrolase [Aquificae bacterium]|nr:bifunctional phosphoribosylaminoimidazolecarboxamide formyltransferase/IMP cyclohydrolase [Aquificota bacterium]